MKTIYFAGGCFWGTEAYFDQLKGVINTEVGYGQGHQDNPTYQEVCAHETGHAEIVKIDYDETSLALTTLIDHLFRIIDPTSVNQQGHDKGEQYRTGIYSAYPEDLTLAKTILLEKQKDYDKPIVVEVEPLGKYYSAEEYHQNYLGKNPTGYCHVNLNLVRSDERKLRRQ